MKRIESPWNLPDESIDRADTADREIRITDFALMAVLPFRSFEVAGFPINEFAMAALVGLCLLRPARGNAKLPEVVILIVAALMTLLVYSGLANHIEWTRRVGHVAILCGLVWAGSTGRLSLRSVGAGLAAGLTAVVALGVAGIGGGAYSGRLTGYLADPNAGAYFLAVLGVLAVFFSDDRWKVRLAVAVPIVTGLVLTYSRTGLLALAFAVAWMFLGRRLGVFGGAAAAAGLVWLVGNIPDDLALSGPFSNRSGSDALRERIIAQERVQLSDAPWFGHGPGTARVQIGDLEFFFHNSYLATRQEGGWPALLLVLALIVYAFLRLTRRARRGDLVAAGAQAALIGVAVMAVTLGEVLLDTPMAVAVAMALGYALREHEPGVVADG
ncbi:O-antigen ligase [Nocardioides sp. BE266]|uniref:O-antigen ligase family protein n=1 Tax=Nocardioides sp. BE266 TaxID=2817725 RepID=UPI0028567885|nr:O-antigen ligase family protein [Nocardioides sp. BE266]MDR7252125.1 O-antigen ligase [Nocardioides sp. BE266]